MVLINSGFYTRKNFSKNYPQLGYAPSKVFASRTLGWKLKKQKSFDRSTKILTFPGPKLPAFLGRPHASGPPWTVLSLIEKETIECSSVIRGRMKPDLRIIKFCQIKWTLTNIFYKAQMNNIVFLPLVMMSSVFTGFSMFCIFLNSVN